jgi:hypothetical protein
MIVYMMSYIFCNSYNLSNNTHGYRNIVTYKTELQTQLQNTPFSHSVWWHADATTCMMLLHVACNLSNMTKGVLMVRLPIPSFLITCWNWKENRIILMNQVRIQRSYLSLVFKAPLCGLLGACVLGWMIFGVKMVVLL